MITLNINVLVSVENAITVGVGEAIIDKRTIYPSAVPISLVKPFLFKWPMNHFLNGGCYNIAQTTDKGQAKAGTMKSQKVHRVISIIKNNRPSGM